MADKKNVVNGLTWNIPIVYQNGTPTKEFMQKWIQQASTNGSIPDLSTPEAVSAVLDVINATRGAVLYRGATTWEGLPPGTAGQVLTTAGPGADPTWAAGGGGSGDIPASIVDDGTNIYLAITDPNGFVVQNPDSSPVVVLEVFPVAAIPILPYVLAARAIGF